MIFRSERVVFIPRSFFFFLIILYMGRVQVEVLPKSGPNPDSIRVFLLFLNPNPTLFLIRLGKIRPIRVGLDRVPAGRVKIAIHNLD